MLIGCMYLAWCIFCSVLLIRWKYYRQWRILTWYLVANCWQILVRLRFPPSDRWGGIHVWFPGELVVLALGAASVIEVLWIALDRFPDNRRRGVCESAGVSMLIAAVCIRWAIPLRQYPDWFDQFSQSDFLALSIPMFVIGLFAFGIALTFNWGNDPRYVWFHALISILLFGSIVYTNSSWSMWGDRRLMFEGLYSVCSLGFLINADLLRKEKTWAVRKGGLVVPPDELDPAPQRHLPAMRSDHPSPSYPSQEPQVWPGYRCSEEPSERAPFSAPAGL
jgi:hypothetical protein